MKKNIIIGIVPNYIEESKDPYDKYFKYTSIYAEKVLEENAIPTGILLNDNTINDKNLEIYNAFIIQGGNKVQKYVYKIIDYAIRNNKPLLGICLGAEAINIYSCIKEEATKEENKTKTYEEIYINLKKKYNNTLLQELEPNNIHNNDTKLKTNYDDLIHEITIIDKQSLAYQIYKKEKLSVPSMHNFDFKHTGSDFKITAIANDNVKEIIEYKNKSHFIIGLHFHPELMKDNEIFKTLVQEAKKRQK